MHKTSLFLFLLVSFWVSGQEIRNVSTADATGIIQKVIINTPANTPKKALSSFQFKEYTKGVLQNKKKDTDDIQPSANDYFFEKLSFIQFEDKILQETVLESNLPGFDKPVYAFFEKKFFSSSVYEKEYIILDKRFFGPLSKRGFKQYDYILEKTVSDVERPYYVIHFSPKKETPAAQIQGTFHIDSQSYAVQKASIQHSENIEALIVHQFQYLEKESLWFPSKTSASVTLLNSNASLNLFGKRIPNGRLNFYDDSRDTFTLETVHYEIKLNETRTIKEKGISIQAMKEENTATPELWNTYRGKTPSVSEALIAKFADRNVRSQDIEKRIERIADLNKGFYQLGFFDLDLKFLVKYNDYEGLRSGLGGVTNERLSKHFTIGGYVVRGFKDEEFKYQLATDFLIHKKSNTILGLAYTKDVAEVGSNSYLTQRRTFSLFEPRLVNISQFYKHKTWQTNIEHRINPKINTELQLSKSDIEQTLPYRFLNNGNVFSDYTLSEGRVSLLWTPFGDYIKTPDEVYEYNAGYPSFSFQVTRAFKDAAGGDFEYSKLDLKVDYIFQHLNQSTTEVLIEGNIGVGDIPLTHTYHAYPNSPNKESILKRFSVAGIRSFETMYFGEFFSDKIASIQLSHRFKPFLISSNFKPELVFTSRHAIGNFDNIENHQNVNFNTLEKGYSESGFEINKLIFGFGVSFAYRYGAYHLPEIEDNISFKFTFNLKI
tara:strand:- start:182365 stop:184512 length:2148 start_codon:yes stop_codon:yes gene_type:complete